ncbi:hypothetical protein HYV82_01600 [Candidatus Woesearchaeota archaeon]|nr:hypothetical protein [Candidatus Woesearchaeota archaeon]
MNAATSLEGTVSNPNPLRWWRKLTGRAPARGIAQQQVTSTDDSENWGIYRPPKDNANGFNVLIAYLTGESRKQFTSFAQQLTDEGFTVIVAPGGAAALEQYKYRHTDALIVEAGLADDADGQQFLSYVRGQYGTPFGTNPVIAIQSGVPITTLENLVNAVGMYHLADRTALLKDQPDNLNLVAAVKEATRNRRDAQGALVSKLLTDSDLAHPESKSYATVSEEFIKLAVHVFDTVLPGKRVTLMVADSQQGIRGLVDGRHNYPLGFVAYHMKLMDEAQIHAAEELQVKLEGTGIVTPGLLKYFSVQGSDGLYIAFFRSVLAANMAHIAQTIANEKPGDKAPVVEALLGSSLSLLSEWDGRMSGKITSSSIRRSIASYVSANRTDISDLERLAMQGKPLDQGAAEAYAAFLTRAGREEDLWWSVFDAKPANIGYGFGLMLPDAGQIMGALYGKDGIDQEKVREYNRIIFDPSGRIGPKAEDIIHLAGSPELGLAHSEQVMWYGRLLKELLPGRDDAGLIDALHELLRWGTYKALRKAHRVMGYASRNAQLFDDLTITEKEHDRMFKAYVRKFDWWKEHVPLYPAAFYLFAMNVESHNDFNHALGVLGQVLESGYTGVPNEVPRTLPDAARPMRMDLKNALRVFPYSVQLSQAEMPASEELLRNGLYLDFKL